MHWSENTEGRFSDGPISGILKKTLVIQDCSVDCVSDRDVLSVGNIHCVCIGH